MPGFGGVLPHSDVNAITQYLLTGKSAAGASVHSHTTTSAGNRQAYVFTGYHRFLDPDGYPAEKPPWGTLNALNVNTGRYVWRIPFGEYPKLAAKGLRHTGSENYGGAVVTKGGLLFIGATSFDRKFRAYNKRTGKLLWETSLPAAGNATPATYAVDDRQFVVIAAGGGKNRPKNTKAGGKVIAFALPIEKKRKRTMKRASSDKK